MKSLFIVFEGIDGSGTSTQANLLKEYFIAEGQKAILSPEPSDGVIGVLIREALATPIIPMEDKRKFDGQMAYLFAADRYYHLYNDRDGVFKLIQEDRCHVITTRYYFSSLVYNCNTPEEFAMVSQLNQRFPLPDLVIYIDIPVEVSLERLKERRTRDIYERKDKLMQVRENYQTIFKNYSDKILHLDGTLAIEILHKQIVDFIKFNFSL